MHKVRAISHLAQHARESQNGRFLCQSVVITLVAFLLAACGANEPTPQVFQATIPAVNQNAPVYTNTPTLTPTLTFTPTLTPTFTLTPSLTATRTIPPSPTFTPTLTFTPSPTLPLWTLTPVSQPSEDEGALSVGGTSEAASFTTPEGWSCVEFPCEDDVDGFLQRIRVPEGYVVDHVGKFPAQPLQIAYGGDGRLYATTLENGTLAGAIYVMNPDGSTDRYSKDTFFSPIGLAFQPGTDVLYISGRVSPSSDGGLWRVLPDGSSEIVLDDLPCCFDVVGNQPNGMVFGPDGYLYLGIGSLTDHAEPADSKHDKFATPQPYEASVLRIQPHTGEIEVYAAGIRNPY
ncbi:MAG TPA: hypothetical protein VHL11_15440, partial [Phototrophicaceae bacterium]|nr:hypothetical protein [Phototrophicaceae bacterium]